MLDFENCRSLLCEAPPERNAPATELKAITTDAVDATDDIRVNNAVAVALQPKLSPFQGSKATTDIAAAVTPFNSPLLSALQPPVGCTIQERLARLLTGL
jgi:hypothetical protein